MFVILSVQIELGFDMEKELLHFTGNKHNMEIAPLLTPCPNLH